MMVSSAYPSPLINAYISPGLTRLNRLQTIGGSSRYLGQDALRLAITEAKAGLNVNKYIEIVEVAKIVDSSSPLAIEDTEWIASRNRKVKAESDRLEHELKGYKNNLIKESIRVRLTSTMIR
jgi:COP9 signalosome complex subunit 1